MAHPPQPPSHATGMSEDRSHFAMIPRLVLESGLSVHAVRLYLEMKMTTGEEESGECWKGTKTLAKACKMSTGTVSNAKLELISKGFIKNLGRIKDSKGFQRDTDTFQVVKIWNRNSEERSPNEIKRSPDERERSPDETNKNPMNKNPEIRTSHSASGVKVGKSELIQMGYERDHAEILSLWNEKMPPRGWLPVNAYSEEVEAVMEIWNADYCEAEDFDLQTAAVFFAEAETPEPNRKPTFVRFMRDNFRHPLTAKQ